MLKATFPSMAFGFRRPAALVCAVTAILFADFGVAFSSDENNLLGRSVDSVKIGRATGLAYVDLPILVRASFASTLTDGLYLSDELAKPYVANFKPNLRSDHSLENRISLTRSISDKLEIGIVWGARSRLTKINFLDFERQTIGAMLRFVH